MTDKIAKLEKEVEHDFKNGGPLVWGLVIERPKHADLVYVNGSVFNYKTDKHASIPLDQILVVTAEERKRRVNEILAECPGADIARLADVLLYDKIYNPSLTKMSDEEYPIMSDRQYERRDSKEVSTVVERMEMNAADGQNHEKPDRRVRNDYENLLIDRRARSRNKERKRKYNEFVKVQPVKRWNMYTGEVYE